MPLESKIFLCALFGSLIMELLYAHRKYNSGKPFPIRYKKFGFWFVRAMMAFSSGILAILYEPTSLLLAVQIGASTPLLISTFAQPVALG